MLKLASTHKDVKHEASRTAGLQRPPRPNLPSTFGNQNFLHLLGDEAHSTELPVGRRGDPQEREADRVAEQVLQTSPCGCGGQCPKCSQARGASVQRRSEPAQDDGMTVAGNFMEHLGPGQPLDTSTRTFFEPRFGRGFGEVRVHNGTRAAESARSINASAYTLGRNMVFGAGRYAPGTADGRRLLAHELTHVVQQRSSGANVVQRQETGSELAAPTPPTPTYGSSCSGGATDPCQLSRCGDRVGGIRDDLTRALGYVDSAIAALGAGTLADATTRALDWYFNDHSDTTATTARERLSCIRDSLNDTRAHDRFGCDLEDSNLGYVCVGSTAVCTDAVTDVCVTGNYFSRSERVRAEVLIHECAHRIGMSLRRNPPDTRMEDVYDFRPRFLYLDTREALLNADSYALFASSISEGVRVTVVGPGLPAFLALSAGAAAPSRGAATWYARAYESLEFQHPVLGIFNPTLGIGFSLIGETESTTPPATFGPSMLVSLLAGVRIGDPRPGAAGGGYASFFGGPSVAVGLGTPRLPAGATAPPSVGAGAEAGMAIGYRWRWLDFSAGVGYTYDPTRAFGSEHLFTATAGVTFIPFSFSIPGSH